MNAIREMIDGITKIADGQGQYSTLSSMHARALLEHIQDLEARAARLDTISQICRDADQGISHG